MTATDTDTAGRASPRAGLRFSAGLRSSAGLRLVDSSASVSAAMVPIEAAG